MFHSTSVRLFQIRAENNFAFPITYCKMQYTLNVFPPVKTRIVISLCWIKIHPENIKHNLYEESLSSDCMTLLQHTAYHPTRVLNNSRRVSKNRHTHSIGILSFSAACVICLFAYMKPSAIICLMLKLVTSSDHLLQTAARLNNKKEISSLSCNEDHLLWVNNNKRWKI